MLKKVMIGTAAWAAMGITGVELMDKFDPSKIDEIIREVVEESDEDDLIRTSAALQKFAREASKIVGGSMTGPIGLVRGLRTMTKKMKERKDKIIEVEFYDFDVVDENEEAVA